MGETVVGGVKLAWQQMGEGPDLVFVHGLAASRAFWFAQYALPLQDRYRCTMYDLRGHGYSERAPDGYSSTALAADLAALLDDLGIERCRLVGHSYGGGIALEYAASHPERVDALCVMDTKVNALQPRQMLADMPYLSPFEIDVAERSGIDWAVEEQIGLRFLEVVARLKAGNAELPSRDAVTPFGEGRGAARTARAWVDLIDTPGVREQLLQPGFGADVLAENLRDTPLLLIYGELSRCMPSCRSLAALLPQAEVEIVPGGGHFFPLSHAASVRPRLQRFLLERPD
jgi:pimeloyl-ACP methyl ester carboxylesterase